MSNSPSSHFLPSRAPVGAPLNGFHYNTPATQPNGKNTMPHQLSVNRLTVNIALISCVIRSAGSVSRVLQRTRCVFLSGFSVTRSYCLTLIHCLLQNWLLVLMPWVFNTVVMETHILGQWQYRCHGLRVYAVCVCNKVRLPGTGQSAHVIGGSRFTRPASNSRRTLLN